MSETVYLATGSGVNRGIYHTDPDCWALNKANGRRTADREHVPDRRRCKVCGEGPWDPPSTCRSCGATRRDDGTCPFCAACDEVGVVNGRHQYDRAARRRGKND